MIYDVIIAGGGLSGAAAAISAGRQGAKVLLVEKSNCLGGAAAAQLVTPFMGNATELTPGGERENLCTGIFTEIIGKLGEYGAVTHRKNIPCEFNEEYLKLILNRMALDAGVQLLFHSYLIDAAADGGTIKTITVANKSGKQTFEGRIFIDATGDADLAVLSGCPTRLGREGDGLCQPMTLCFRVAGVDVEAFIKAGPFMQKRYKELCAEGKIKNIRENVLWFHLTIDGIIHFNTTRIVKLNPVDSFELTTAEIEAREQVAEMMDFFTREIDGLQNAKLLSTAMSIGVRESRMIDGDYILTGDDLRSCKRFSDSIALGCYDIDIHNPEGSGTSHYYFPPGEYYTIPYRSLIALNTKNLLVAGRCISVTHEAQASIRIMPIVCCIGEAAGTAAGLCIKNQWDIRGVDIDMLQKTLRDNGVSL